MSTLDCLLSLHFPLLCGILYHWLSIKHIAKLDSAYCSSAKRYLLLDILSSPGFIQHYPVHVSFGHKFLWYIHRSVGISNIHVNTRLSVSEKVSSYFFRWGQNIREIHFSTGASGDLYLIPMHCKNLLSLSNSCCAVQQICHEILRFNPNLRKVAFDSVALMPFIFKDVWLPQLRMLRITGKAINYELFRAIGQFCDGLTHLDLPNNFLNRPGLVELVARQKKLISIDFAYTDMDEDDIADLAPVCHGIVNLSLNNNCDISDAAILIISQHLLCLRTLDLRGCSEFTDTGLTYLSESIAAQLTVLYLSFSGITFSDVATLLRQCKSLHTLGLDAFEGMDFDLENFSELCKTISSIQILHLQGATLIEDSALECIGRYCKDLTHIALLKEDDPQYAHTYCTVKGMLALHFGCAKLRTLVVFEGCRLLWNEWAIALWKELRPGFCITSVDSIDYDALKYSF